MAVVLLVIFAVVSITVAIYRRRAVTVASEFICGSLLYLIHIVQTTEVNPSYEPGNGVSSMCIINFILSIVIAVVTMRRIELEKNSAYELIHV